MPDVNPDADDLSGGRADNLQEWSVMRRLSEQLTEATLAAMQKADASFPGKPLLDVPILACPKCHKPEPLYSNDALNEKGQHSNWHAGLQRCGRSKSIALSGLDRGCNYCTAYYYQNPLKDYIWSRPSVHSSRAPTWQQHYSFQSRCSSVTPVNIDIGDIPAMSGLYRDVKLPGLNITKGAQRRSSSLIEIPTKSSQHTQTIFSSITSGNDFSSAGNKSRYQLKSGSMYSKHASGLRFQLPPALQRTKSFRKRGLDFGLRKTLSVTNAIVRMPIESATPSSKKNLDTSTGDATKYLLFSNTTSSPSIPKQTPNTSAAPSIKVAQNNKTIILHNDLYNASESGSLHSWPAGHTASTMCNEDEEASGETLRNHRVSMPRKHSLSDGYIAQVKTFAVGGETSNLVEDEAQTRPGKRDVQLQTMEDFEKEIKSSFNIPRILNEEDQTKEPDEGLNWESPSGMDDTSKQRSKEYWKEQFLLFFQPSDNKLAKKLFGTKVALNKERSRQRKQGKWIIHPASNFRFYWDLLMLVLLIANLIILPVFISFFLEDLGFQAICFNCVSDTIFLLDIVVNFRTVINLGPDKNEAPPSLKDERTSKLTYALKIDVVTI
ncbi:unnamed protein product [Hydatigera taeniaeformis]|uniref:Ion_trans_N domain-containing protein n=1 Tax=Hydatigena taeniaeformis TaxID=6205 RepID=A0A0R3X8J9_HYDTA|nr:unnamed protein product [Hydatigera taeniaeformis]